MNQSEKPKRKPKTGKKAEKESIRGILLLLEGQNLSPAVEWYVKRLSEVYDEIAAGKAPKVKLEILQELRDFIIPAEERKPITEIFDPAAEGTETLPGPTGILRGTGTDA